MTIPSSKPFIIQKIEENPLSYLSLSDEDKKDSELALLAIHQSESTEAEIFSQVPMELRKDKSFLLKVFSKVPVELSLIGKSEFVPDEMFLDKEIFMSILKSHCFAISRNYDFYHDKDVNEVLNNSAYEKTYTKPEDFCKTAKEFAVAISLTEALQRYKDVPEHIKETPDFLRCLYRENPKLIFDIAWHTKDKFRNIGADDRELEFIKVVLSSSREPFEFYERHLKIFDAIQLDVDETSAEEHPFHGIYKEKSMVQDRDLLEHMLSHLPKNYYRTYKAKSKMLMEIFARCRLMDIKKTDAGNEVKKISRRKVT